MRTTLLIKSSLLMLLTAVILLNTTPASASYLRDQTSCSQCTRKCSQRGEVLRQCMQDRLAFIHNKQKRYNCLCMKEPHRMR